MGFIAHISSYLIDHITSFGYLGVGLFMAIDSAAIPLPSEVIMPFSGYLVYKGRLTLLGVSLAGGFGSLIGSIVLYYVGYYGGRALVESYGHYVFIDHHDLEVSDKFFKRWGGFSSFIGRIIPLVRTYISFPAGISRVEFKRFVIYSFLGSFVWSLFLAWIGYRLGPSWDSVSGYFHRFDALVIILVVSAAGYYIYRHISKHKKRRAQKQAQQ